MTGTIYFSGFIEICSGGVVAVKNFPIDDVGGLMSQSLGVVVVGVGPVSRRGPGLMLILLRREPPHQSEFVA